MFRSAGVDPSTLDIVFITMLTLGPHHCHQHADVENDVNVAVVVVAVRVHMDVVSMLS